MDKRDTNMHERRAWAMPTELQARASAGDRTSVMKFDGSSFATREHFGPVCQWLRRRLDEGGPRHRIVCVVSAPSGSAEQYRDTLLAHGISATVVAGNRIGLRTGVDYPRVRPQGINLTVLRQQLTQHQVVVVVPGGQASATRGGETTWRGTNSSDLSAIALAAALGEEELEIYSDVPGVFSCDPGIVDSATLIPRLPYAQAIQMATSGAKVLHHRAVQHALQNRLRVVCRRNRGNFETGTVLVADAAFQPAIVADARSQTFEASIGAAEDVAQQLAAADVPHVLMPGMQEGTRHVVVTCGFFDAWHFLATERQLPVVKQDTMLLTRVRLDGGVKRELVAPSALAARARELHHIHCAPASPQTRAPAETSAPADRAAAERAPGRPNGTKVPCHV
ncbi:amino acid kinase family protein [Variovorax sp. RA8]|uniref:amino acid kinase family protein n=1 Tax=Variovorax sp. (strain JCM 16519 / RA8) TaxID=662548 RepID=UPI0013174FF7|nr:hypothetical protein [Variovorax sp. RA8]VTU22735.1 Aspartokinase [Variovorax sp. RA8]